MHIVRVIMRKLRECRSMPNGVLSFQSFSAWLWRRLRLQSSDELIDPRKRQLTAIIVVILAAVVAVVFYAFVNPIESRWAPQCSFYAITDYECPGCGLQRAIHSVLHGDFASAWSFNPFLFFIAPVGFCYLGVELSGRRLQRLRRVMFSSYALCALIAVTIAWWIVRNLWCPIFFVFADFWVVFLLFGNYVLTLTA